MYLQPDSRIPPGSLDNKVEVTLVKGGLFSRVVRRLTGRYTVRMETAFCGVRRTEFFVAYGRSINEHPDIWLCVNTGLVEVAISETAEKILVEEGKGINIVGGLTLTKPRFYPWTQKLNWNTDPQSGDVSDRTDLEQVYSDPLDLDYN